MSKADITAHKTRPKAQSYVNYAPISLAYQMQPRHINLVKKFSSRDSIEILNERRRFDNISEQPGATNYPSIPPFPFRFTSHQNIPKMGKSSKSAAPAAAAKVNADSKAVSKSKKEGKKVVTAPVEAAPVKVS
jgi:hypothetical protein